MYLDKDIPRKSSDFDQIASGKYELMCRLLVTSTLVINSRLQSL